MLTDCCGPLRCQASAVLASLQQSLQLEAAQAKQAIEREWSDVRDDLTQELHAELLYALASSQLNIGCGGRDPRGPS